MLAGNFMLALLIAFGNAVTAFAFTIARYVSFGEFGHDMFLLKPLRFCYLLHYCHAAVKV